MNILRFGLWRGQSIRDVEIEYVLWLLGQRWFRHKHIELYASARRRAMQHFAAEVAREQHHYLDDLA